MGNTTVIRSGDVQRMTAGTGLTHSEINRSDTPVHFYQIWLYPDVAGLAPSYDQKSFQPKDWENCLLPVASGQGFPGTVEFHTDATIYRSELATGKTVKFEGTNGRRIFIYLTRGSLDMNGIGLQENDQARIDTESALVLKARKPSELILIDVPSCKGWGLDEAILRGERG
jgi:redox-sensitive bicupin YhaK (pirin superfamily)